ncbi:MAG: c-type cytochrome [Nitrospiria bacterium]
MSQPKIVVVLLLMIAGFGLAIHFFTSAIAPPEADPSFNTFSISRPRAPSEARKIANPVQASDTVIEKGDAIYHGKGNCNICHGEKGKGDGQAGEMLSPPPANLSNPSLQMLRTDGEMFWSIKHGVQGTGMFSYIPRMITEEEAWMVIHYIRTLEKEVETES